MRREALAHAMVARRLGVARARKPTYKATPVAEPRAAMMTYEAALVGVVRKWRTLLIARVRAALPRLMDAAPHVRHDNFADEFAGFMSDTGKAFAQVVPKATVNDIAGQQVTRVNKKNKGEVTRQFKQALGIDLYQSDPWYQATADAFIGDNVALITSVGTDMLGSMEKTIRAAARSGQRVERTARDIGKRFDVSESRARLIARDQTLKLNGEMTEARHKDAGIDEYDWSTSQDERVRPGHAELEGKTFSYSKPPVVDKKTGRRANPGQDFQCRCNGLPNFDKIEKRLDELVASPQGQAALAGRSIAETPPEPVAEPTLVVPPLEAPIVSVPRGTVEYTPPVRPDPDRPVVETPLEEMSQYHRAMVEKLRAHGLPLIIEDYRHPEVQGHIEDLSLVPEHLMKELARRGYKFHLADRGVAGFPGHKHEKGKLNEQDIPWEDVPGAFDTKTLEGLFGTGNNPKSGSLALHETAHAIVQSRRLLDAAMPILRDMMSEGRHLILGKYNAKASQRDIANELLAEALADTLRGESLPWLAKRYGAEVILFLNERVVQQ